MKPIRSPIELNRAGKQALIEALGFDGMIRFIRQFEPSSGNYTEERHQWLDRLTADEVFAQIKQASTRRHK
ncbi:hypothetical protein [Halomicronema sp. CCY15110]|uniref:hypothetical protein n=1 Tax=Halomicronema sp. CCY15110 TaxID=2767773 RepID=UPI0019517B80|nr:hypothetical protein [Halomicronema sp. CCY15110]